MARFLRVLRAQWFVIAFIALLGAGTAVGAAEIRNRSLDSKFEAVAPISVLRLVDERDENYSRRLETALAQARSAVVTQLAEDERLTVTSDSSLGTVQFVAVAPTPDEAVTAATDLRASYLKERPANIAEDQLAPLLDALATEIAAVEADLAAVGGGETDPIVAARRSALLSQLQATAVEAVSLDAELLDPSLTKEERAELEAKLAATKALMNSIGPKLKALPSDTTHLEAMVLERRLNDLQSQYVSTALARAEGVEGLVGEPSVNERSSAPVSPLLALLTGLAAGSLLGCVAVVASDRLRQPIRTVEDVSGVTLLEVSRRSRKGAGVVNWYQAAANDSRRTHMQALRARLERFLEQRSVVLVGGVEAPLGDVTDVAVDLASAIAATGRSVLLIDTQMGDASLGADRKEGVPGRGADPTVWADAGPSLAEMLATDEGTVPDRSVIKRLLWDRSEVAPNLIVVPAGVVDYDPIDALAGLGFAMVVEEARELVSVVVLSGGDMSESVSEAVAGRAQIAVLVAVKDQTRMSHLTAMASNLDQIGVTLGVGALLGGREARGPRRRPPKRTIKSRPTQLGRGARHVKTK